MANYQELIETVLSGTSDANIRFSELCSLLRRLGFDERIRGSHHVFRKQGTREKINLQPQSGYAKVYQVRQIRKIFIEYGIRDV